MKSDSYLSLCLEQAAKSPLHYRHGAVVVRGGKVIGLGHNDYRPGFSGGALKNGRIAHGSYDGAAVAELKKKLRAKKLCQQHQQRDKSSMFVPFESTTKGDRHAVSQPLSMHAEMMAIYSALNASSTMSSTIFSREKPGFHLPRADKRKARLRRTVLEAYVKAVCDTAAGTGKPQVQLAHNNNAKYDNYNVPAPVSTNSSVVFHQRSQNHHPNWKNEKKNKKNVKNRQYQYQHQYDRSGRARCLPQPSVSDPKMTSAAPSNDSDMVREYENVITNDDANETTTAATNSGCSHRVSKRKKDYKRVRNIASTFVVEVINVLQSGKMRPDSAEEDADQPLLLGAARVTSSNHRKQHPRLKGADVYVVRVGWSGVPLYKPGKMKRTSTPPAPTTSDESDLARDTLDLSVSSLESLSIASTSSDPHPGTGSLHDELINREPSSPSRPQPATMPHECTFDRDKIHASRPCYRCVAFMHHVGIRRVFWTNDAGEWEGHKVSALIDAMDSGMEDAASGGPTGNGVFVTKHEVLMLRRMMEGKAGT